MTRKKLIIFLTAAIFLFGVFAFFKWSSAGTDFLWKISNGGTQLLPLVAVASLLDSINPCAFSILILTIAFLLSIGKARGSILKLGSAYVFGIFLVYMLIGLGILQTLHIFNTPHFMAKVGAILLIFLGGINLVNEFFPNFPIKLRISPVAHNKMAEFMEKGSLPAVFLLGILVGLCEFPCTGGPYLMVLGLLHDSTTYLPGLGYLLLYNLIFILPLVIILLIASNQMLLGKVQAWQTKERGWMRLGGGVAMVGLGMLILFL
ncbi:hypothetical protein A3I25_00760 [Candidatus Nomurabacteria bacterium RIFCSPLOWO2_02_FULL_42_17]|uniref:Uncharacterized protein n=2 Tax=Candidatus Nomuraibacteriota TaxID=1752729 RepID=A0A1F6WIF0_9BACT|nr:MAG: hypothetical protein UV08_C0016G0015 [Parcubacteria group bacterium GW2011_GWA2_42_18]OGI81668.1 MAG: hypothetical protein A3B93_01840 [Candidatus Nomurabacteria bacterium RIFCSPHIGHO2_02_FULL_42_24]OGI96780.1 MAG: hypothetical protein A3I25_00760 [Candidatus Nomurabacteria bacterium RIFCSPLOWO2_02_FULL_42_17]